jgi:hypothetical protein
MICGELHIFFQILNNMYNRGMSLALTQMVVMCGVGLGHGHYILYVWDRDCEMRFFLDEGDIYYMNVSSNDCDWVLFVEILDIHSFFTMNLLNFSMYFFLLSQGVHKIDSRITI